MGNLTRKRFENIERRNIAEEVDGAAYLQFAHSPYNNEGIEFLVTLLDVSPSMLADDLEPSRLEVACAANRSLITTKAANHPNDHIAVIGFGGAARLLHKPAVVGDNTQSLLRSLDSIECMEWTNFDAALTLAESVLRPPETAAANVYRGVSRLLSKVLGGNGSTALSVSDELAGDRWVRRIVLLSDGERTQGPSPVPTAERLKKMGVIIDCIGIADRENVDEATLKAIASRNPDGSPRYCFIQDRHSLLRKYEALAGHIRVIKE